MTDVLGVRYASNPQEVLRVLADCDEEFTDDAFVRLVAAQAMSGPPLMVGFNRRFSPLAQRLRQEFEQAGPLAVQYRVNAGPIPRTHWIHDAEQGGGRIIGEVCHFLDFAQFLTDDEPSEVFAYSVGGYEGERHDTVSIAVRFRRGSIASTSL